MRTRLERSYRFEAAHFLPKVPPGHKCARMHGHSYHDRDRDRRRDRSRARLGHGLRRHRRARAPLVRQLDHQVLNEIDGLANPTSELLAVWWWQRLAPALPGLVEVVVSETPTSRCVYRGRVISASSRSTSGAPSRRSSAGSRSRSASSRALAPDVVCMQEVRPLDGLAGRTTADAIAEALGMHAHYAKAVRVERRRCRHAEGRAGGPRDHLARAAPRDARARAARAATRRHAPPALGARRDRRPARSGSTRRISTTGSTTASRASSKSSRSTRRCARSAATRTARRRSCAATSTRRPTPTRCASCAG